MWGGAASRSVSKSAPILSSLARRATTTLEASSDVVVTAHSQRSITGIEIDVDPDRRLRCWKRFQLAQRQLGACHRASKRARKRVEMLHSSMTLRDGSTRQGSVCGRSTSTGSPVESLRHGRPGHRGRFVRPRRLSSRCDALRPSLIGQGALHTPRTVDYAWPLHKRGFARGAGTAPPLLLGMNPGPWGTAQAVCPSAPRASFVKTWLFLTSRSQHLQARTQSGQSSVCLKNGKKSAVSASGPCCSKLAHRNRHGAGPPRQPLPLASSQRTRGQCPTREAPCCRRVDGLRSVRRHLREVVEVLGTTRLVGVELCFGPRQASWWL